MLVGDDISRTQLSGFKTGDPMSVKSPASPAPSTSLLGAVKYFFLGGPVNLTRLEHWDRGDGSEPTLDDNSPLP